MRGLENLPERVDLARIQLRWEVLVEPLRTVAVLDRNRLFGRVVHAADLRDLERLNRVCVGVQLEMPFLQQVPQGAVVGSDVPEVLEREETHRPELVLGVVGDPGAG